MVEQTINKKIKVGIIGGAGYTGGELLRILINHPNVEIAFVHSNSNAGNLISDVHTDLFGDTNLKFTGREDFENLFNETAPLEGDLKSTVLFLCVGHGNARKFLEGNSVHEDTRIIDLSQDFRLTDNQNFDNRSFIYGLPEFNRSEIKKATNIANPGCFSTCIQLGLLPLASKGLLKNEVHINATTGSTGAGQSLSSTTHFSWRNNNLSVYKAFQHQHLQEISETLNSLQVGFLGLDKKTLLEKAAEKLILIPQRGDFTRGILAAMYTECDLSLEEAQQLYEEYYSSHPFTHVSIKNIDLKQVVNTNKCLVHLEKDGNKLLIISIVDNLLKGASGQAVQNMNLIFGLDETTGLRLKGVGF